MFSKILLGLCLLMSTTLYSQWDYTINDDNIKIAWCEDYEQLVALKLENYQTDTYMYITGILTCGSYAKVSIFFETVDDNVVETEVIGTGNNDLHLLLLVSNMNIWLYKDYFKYSTRMGIKISDECDVRYYIFDMKNSNKAYNFVK